MERVSYGIMADASAVFVWSPMFGGAGPDNIAWRVACLHKEGRKALRFNNNGGASITYG